MHQFVHFTFWNVFYSSNIPTNNNNKPTIDYIIASPWIGRKLTISNQFCNVIGWFPLRFQPSRIIETHELHKRNRNRKYHEMEANVQRSNSQRSQSNDNCNGPRVSFNKDVHVKRIGLSIHRFYSTFCYFFSLFLFMLKWRKKAANRYSEFLVLCWQCCVVIFGDVNVERWLSLFWAPILLLL